MRDKESNWNGVYKTTNWEIFNCTLTTNVSMNWTWFILFAICFFFFLCMRYAAVDVAKTECQITIIIIEYERATEWEKWNEWAIMPFCCCCTSTSINVCESTNCWINSAHLFRWTMHLTSLSSSSSSSSSLVYIVFCSICSLHLCTAWLLHLHNAHQTHLNCTCNSYFIKELWKRWVQWLRRWRWLWWGQRGSSNQTNAHIKTKYRSNKT